MNGFGNWRPVFSWQTVAGMRDNGFMPVDAKQGRSRVPGKEDFTKHLIRFRPAGEVVTTRRIGGLYPEVVVVNSHDGTSAYKVMAGLLRMVCLNGMIVADRERKRHDYRARELLADLRAMGKPAPATVRDAAWHEAHGYALHNGHWIAEILLRSQLAHEEGIERDREIRRQQALELACLTYGPQPGCPSGQPARVAAAPFADIAVDDLQLAEAAD
jgi:Domain of unknown function (DUF932)